MFKLTHHTTRTTDMGDYKSRDVKKDANKFFTTTKRQTLPSLSQPGSRNDMRITGSVMEQRRDSAPIVTDEEARRDPKTDHFYRSNTKFIPQR